MRTHERPTTEPGTQAEDRARLMRALRFCLWVFLALRVGLSLVALAGVGLLPDIDNEVGPPGWPASPVTPGWHNVVTAWERFDGLWFLRIATDGYVDGDGSAAFFPLYPLLIRGLTPLVGGHPLAAALLISHVAAFGSMVLLYVLTASEWDERVARRTVVYLAVFPTSFFLLAPYSESLYLLCALACLWGARRGRWAVAGAAGAAAAATRNIGVLLVIPLVVEAIQRWREDRSGRGLARAVLWTALVPLGVAAYLLYWQASAGDALAPLHQQVNWQREASFPLATLLRGTREAFRFVGEYPGGYHLVDWVIVVPAVIAGIWVVRRARPMYTGYTWASMLAPLSFIFPLRPFMSVPRFLLVVFPLFWAGAVWGLRRRGVHEALVAGSAVLLGVLTVLFVNWYYVF